MRGRKVLVRSVEQSGSDQVTGNGVIHEGCRGDDFRYFVTRLTEAVGQ